MGVAKVPGKILPPSDPPPGEFKDWLVARMKELGLSQAELARRSGADNSTINQLRSGEAKPGIRVLRKLAHPLGLQLPEILVIAGQIDPGEWEAPALPPLPPVIQKIMGRLEIQTDRENQAMLNAVASAVVIFDEVNADLGESPREPKRRSR